MVDILSSPKTILVTGATGLLGEAVTKVLLKEGHHVRAMARSLQRAQPLGDLGADIIPGDMTDLPFLERAVSGCQVVFHFAGILTGDSSSKDLFHQVNVEGTRYLAKTAKASGVQLFIHASTAWVYGWDACAGTTEHSAYRISQDLYIDTKIKAEYELQQLRREGLPLVIVQPSQVYGPKDRHWTLTPLRLMQSGMMFLVNGGCGLIQPIYVDDVVEGIIAAARRGRIGETYLLCGQEAISMKRYYSYLGEMIGQQAFPSLPGSIMMVVASLIERFSALMHRHPLISTAEVRSNMMNASYSGDKAYNELGFIPQIHLEEGMAKVAAWLAEEKPLKKS
jgi:nucleoside-diphosphate-sugar epimerase